MMDCTTIVWVVAEITAFVFASLNALTPNYKLVLRVWDKVRLWFLSASPCVRAIYPALHATKRRRVMCLENNSRYSSEGESCSNGL